MLVREARQVAKQDDVIDETQQVLIKSLFAGMQARPELVPDASRML